MGVIHDSVIDARRADSIRDLAFDSLANEGKLSKHVEGNVYWIQFELHWRDYFYYVSQKFSRMRSFNTERLRKARRMAPDSPAPGEAGTASSLFNLGGFQEVLKPHESAKTIDNWKPFDLSDPGDKARLFFQGKTGVPFLDAALRVYRLAGRRRMVRIPARRSRRLLEQRELAIPSQRGRLRCQGEQTVQPDQTG
jgi:deoxyribodipyrimidine photolyase